MSRFGRIGAQAGLLISFSTTKTKYIEHFVFLDILTGGTKPLKQYKSQGIRGAREIVEYI
jgi:hypothetical protein